MTDNGQLERQGDLWQLRFVRELNHPPAKVWKALTEPKQVNAWFPAEIHGDRAAGAKLRFVFANDEGPTLEGEMRIYDPPNVLEFTWDKEILRFELEPAADGTVLTFLNTFGELGKAARDAAGWHSCLDMLPSVIAGEKPHPDPMQRWREVHPHYIEAFGPEASTIGPPDSIAADG